ncbi:dihydrofolate reductase family protein [Nocardia lijiangensis]|uniref:dihydrofolate reductase family protein n=1 Tax=Nocardia lijiangensis TaxID=299618 RepID=UPI001FDF0102|nr:dihydrofolate reductase family protein [Nocardia lijiangensis]
MEPPRAVHLLQARRDPRRGRAAAARGRNGERQTLTGGGGELAGRFADAGLLDEVIVGITPVTLGGGAPLLPRRILSDRMRLVDVARMGQFAQLTYQLS